jgi:GT2 family glycosyltransferase
MLDASLILVNYRCEDETRQCLADLAQLGAAKPRQRIVFDNSPERGLASSPGFEDLCELYQSSPQNLGFAAAVNRAAARATQPYLILLNPDACPDPDCLPGLIDALEDEPGIGLAGPRLLPAVGFEPSPSATRVDPNLWTSLIEYTVLHRLCGRGWLDRHYFVDPERGRQVCATLQGACLVIRRSLFERLGGFDPRFFFYWEDTDLARRARALGYRALYCPGLSCRHEGGRSVAGEDIKARHFWRGLRAYHRKHGGRKRLIPLRLLLPLGISMELMVLIILDRLRRGKDAVLRRDLGVHRLRLREQFRSMSS